MRRFRGWLAIAAALCVVRSAVLAQTIIVGDAAGTAGDQVVVTVTLSTGGTRIAGTQNDIDFDPQARIGAKATGDPDCVVNTDIDKRSPIFRFRPRGCGGDTCTGIRALVFAADNVDPIPDGAALYTCTVTIALDAANGAYALTTSGVILADPIGNAIPGASGVSGSVTVSTTPLRTPSATHTRTATISPTPTASFTPTPSPTPTPSLTPTPTRKPTATPTPCLGTCGGGPEVTVAGVLTMVNVALDLAPLAACNAGDANADGRITIDEVLTAVNNALYGCGVMPLTPVPRRIGGR